MKYYIYKYEKIILSILILRKIFYTIGDLKFIRWIMYRIKYPYLYISSSCKLEGNIILEQNGHLTENIFLSGNISIERNTSIHDDCRFLGNISIGDNSLIAYNVFASTSKHNFNTNPYSPIIIQDFI